MRAHRSRSILAQAMLGLGVAGVLATGADHLDEYVANGFSTVPTIGTLFLANFIAATVVGVGLLLPLGRISPRFGDAARTLLALTGIGIGAGSLVALWVSETSSLFGFTDYGFRPTIVVAIVAEATAVLALTAYLGLTQARAAFPGSAVRRHRAASQS